MSRKNLIPFHGTESRDQATFPRSPRSNPVARSLNCRSIACRYPVASVTFSSSDSLRSSLRDLSRAAGSAFARRIRSVGIDNVTFLFSMRTPRKRQSHINMCTMPSREMQSRFRRFMRRRLPSRPRGKPSPTGTVIITCGTSSAPPRPSPGGRSPEGAACRVRELESRTSTWDIMAKLGLKESDPTEVMPIQSATAVLASTPARSPACKPARVYGPLPSPPR